MPPVSQSHPHSPAHSSAHAPHPSFPHRQGAQKTGTKEGHAPVPPALCAPPLLPARARKREDGTPTPAPWCGRHWPSPYTPRIHKRRDGVPTSLPSAWAAPCTQEEAARPPQSPLAQATPAWPSPTCPMYTRGGMLSPTCPTLPAHARGGAVRLPQHPPCGRRRPNPTRPAPLAWATPTSPTPSPGTQGDGWPRQPSPTLPGHARGQMARPPPSAGATAAQPGHARGRTMRPPIHAGHTNPAPRRPGTQGDGRCDHPSARATPTQPHAARARKGMDGVTTRPRGPRQPSSTPPGHAKGQTVRPPIRAGHASPAPRCPGTQGDGWHDHPSPLCAGDSSPAPRTPHRPARVRKGGTARPPPPHGLRQPQVDAPYHARARLGMQECRPPGLRAAPGRRGCAGKARRTHTTRARAANPREVRYPSPLSLRAAPGRSCMQGEVAHAKGAHRAKRGAREGGNTERGCTQPEREWRTRVSLRAAPGRRHASGRATHMHTKGVRDGTTQVRAANLHSARKDVRVRRGATRVGELCVSGRVGTSKWGCGAKRSPGEAVWEWRARP
ncbi:hypothetical protein EDB89DRAFT_1913258 [Lactarius sanguifluus]|nr:hypothetical protein EDB89DRAFT_1913258 [Lactarius sanguifluus]